MSIDQTRDDSAGAPGLLAVLFNNAAVDPVYAPYGIFLLRLAVGVDWIVHAFLKTYRGMNTHEALLAKNGITPLLAWPTFSVELIGGFALLPRWDPPPSASFPLAVLARPRWLKIDWRLSL